MSETLLVTGAAGYIGSHFVESLLRSPLWQRRAPRLVLLDDLSTGHREFIDALAGLATQSGFPAPVFEKLSLIDAPSVSATLLRHRPSAVVHFAARISVGESVANPGLYFLNNVEGSKNLLQAMRAAGCGRMIFSSTAAVYGTVTDPALASRPLDEDTPLAPINPYGETKLRIERELAAASVDWGLKSLVFRYFNAAGASPSGLLGEWHEPETHLIPLLLRSIASGSALRVYGDDYPTRDGSCIRDYIHVSDLASAHLLGLERLIDDSAFAGGVFNLGTEAGTSVLEVIRAAEAVAGKKVLFEVHPRRAGDSAVLVAASKRAREMLGWNPVHSGIETILKTAQAWEHRLHSSSSTLPSG